MKIDHFRGEYAFLSNFWEVPVTYKGLTYGSNEAAFQAQKCMTEEEKVEFTQLRPSAAKKLGPAHFNADIGVGGWDKNTLIGSQCIHSAQQQPLVGNGRWIERSAHHNNFTHKTSSSLNGYQNTVVRKESLQPHYMI